MSVTANEARSIAMQGNANATKARLVTDTLRRIAIQKPEKLRKACEKLFNKAISGDVVAFKELADRLEGKVSSGDSSPVRVYIVKDTDQLPPIDVTPIVQSDQDDCA